MSPRVNFDKQLDELNDKLKKMGEAIECSIERASEALIKKDVKLAKMAIDCDSQVNDMEREIERICLALLLHQSPVAKDLRQISAALKMITDMERISDQAADIAELVILIAESGADYFKPLVHLPKMAETAISMVTLSVEAFINKDEAMAIDVMKMDDIMDEYFVLIREEIIAHISEKIDNAAQALDLFMITKYFERIGDHAENLAEWAEFAATGVHRRAIEVVHPELFE